MKKRLIIIISSVILLAVVIAVALNAARGVKRQSDDRERLVVASPHPNDFIRPLINEFESETGIYVEVIECGTSEAVEMIRQGDDIDILWGGSVLTVGADKELFYPYKTENYKSFSPEFKQWGENITCFSDVPSVLMVNTDLLGDTEINGYEDLLKPEFKGKIACADPRRSSSSFEQLVNILYAMGDGDPDRGWDYAKALAEQLDGDLISSSSGVYQGVSRGDYVVGLTFEEAAVTMIKSGKHVQIRYMDEGVVSTPDGLYINKTAGNLENAKIFTDFMTAYDTQNYISQDLGRRPVRSDVEDSSLVMDKENIYIIDVDGELVTSNKDVWTERFVSLVGEGK